MGGIEGKKQYTVADLPPEIRQVGERVFQEYGSGISPDKVSLTLGSLEKIVSDGIWNYDDCQEKLGLDCRSNFPAFLALGDWLKSRGLIQAKVSANIPENSPRFVSRFFSENTLGFDEVKGFMNEAVRAKANYGVSGVDLKEYIKKVLVEDEKKLVESFGEKFEMTDELRAEIDDRADKMYLVSQGKGKIHAGDKEMLGIAKRLFNQEKQKHASNFIDQILNPVLDELSQEYPDLKFSLITLKRRAFGSEALSDEKKDFMDFFNEMTKDIPLDEKFKNVQTKCEGVSQKKCLELKKILLKLSSVASLK